MGMSKAEFDSYVVRRTGEWDQKVAKFQDLLVRDGPVELDKTLAFLKKVSATPDSPGKTAAAFSVGSKEEIVKFLACAAMGISLAVHLVELHCKENT